MCACIKKYVLIFVVQMSTYILTVTINIQLYVEVHLSGLRLLQHHVSLKESLCVLLGYTTVHRKFKMKLYCINNYYIYLKKDHSDIHAT